MIEKTILENLVYNEDFLRKVSPFLSERYFKEKSEKVIYETIAAFFVEYNKQITPTILNIELSKRKDVTESEYRAVKQLASSLTKTSVDDKWLIDSTEKWCKRAAVFDAMVTSLAIFEGRDKTQNEHAIPSLMQTALNVSFTTHIGHDYINDAESRFDYYHRVEERIPFDIDILNLITKGGLTRKTLNGTIAECVHPKTKVTIRIRTIHNVANNWQELEVTIDEIESLLNTHDVEVDSPDGFVPVLGFVHKEPKLEFVLQIGDKTIRCSEFHLFETMTGWKFARDLTSKEHSFLTKNGYMRGSVHYTGNLIPIVDITVDHPNHRYYTNGVSSHNSGAGKSAWMCHLAASTLKSGRNVLYISMEMAEEKLAERIDANLMGIDINDIAVLDKDQFMSKIDKIKAKSIGILKIKEFPTSSVHAGHFRALLEELKAKENFKPELIIIDYLNICCSSRVKMGASINTYTYVKFIAEELRGLAVEYDVPIWTATQTNRSGYDNTDISLTDTSECILSSELVELRDGSLKQMKNIVLGDQIVDNVTYKTVNMVHHPKIKPCYKISLKSGKTITVSNKHVFPSNAGRLSLETGLTIGHKLLSVFKL